MIENNLFLEISPLGREISFKKNEHLFFSEQPSNGFYYIKSGLIRLYKSGEEGNEVELNRLGKGNFIGEVILFSSETFPVNALAVELSTTLFFDKTTILSSIAQTPSIAQSFLKLLAQKCISLNQSLELLTLKTVRERLLLHLNLLARRQGTNTIKLPMTKLELAKSLGTISETLSRNLKQLEKEGILSVTGKTITLLNPKNVLRAH